MDIVFTFPVRAEAEKIFQAITTKKGYQGWWAAVCDIDCRLDKHSSIRFEKDDITEEMCFKVVDVKENKRLVWHCYKNNVFESMLNTTLAFDIQEEADGCQVTFTLHSADKQWKQHPEYDHIREGWKFFMKSLKDYCETGRGEPWG